MLMLRLVDVRSGEDLRPRALCPELEDFCEAIGSTDKGKGGNSDHLPPYFTLCMNPIYREYKFALQRSSLLALINQNLEIP